ncbi:unnamed protein product [Larinioides sclopetarius]|uniref:Uncharacterized protein n=1 Tax=Larinioides sclopetarius TaxID=280406 RepID=A0AAV2AKR9_9ARAC
MTTAGSKEIIFPPTPASTISSLPNEMDSTLQCLLPVMVIVETALFLSEDEKEIPSEFPRRSYVPDIYFLAGIKTTFANKAENVVRSSGVVIF